MDIPSVHGREKDILTFMKEHGYPVFHRSNIFLRDFQYGVRDYYRTTFKTDIGSRKSDAWGRELIKGLETFGALIPGSENVWIINMEEFLNPPKVEEKKAETPAA